MSEEKRSELSVVNIKVSKHSIKETPELIKLIETISKYQDVDARNLLPEASWYHVEFQFNNTYVGFANGIRRMLVEELPVYCLTIDDADIETDDEFILNDMLIKNLNLLPIIQEIKTTNVNQAIDKVDDKINNKIDNKIDDKIDDVKAHLNVHNNTNEIIDVLSGDIKISGTGVIDKNIIIYRLRPGRYLKMKNIYAVRGFSKYNAAKFSLLNNIRYRPLDHKPFDIKTNTGERSIKVDPTSFFFSFTTCGNIEVATVFKLLHNQLIARLNRILESFKEYSKESGKKYYVAANLIVSNEDDIYLYKIPNEYITLSTMIAQRCLLLNPQIAYVAANIERYDNEVAMIKIRDPDANKLLIAATMACINDVNHLHKELMKSAK